MIWVISIGVAAVAAVGAIFLSPNSPEPVRRRKRSLLELNINRLAKELRAKSGPKIAILGQPGAGKSSLLKNMTENKVVPVPAIGAETDATNWASDGDCNLLSRYKKYVFADVPGYDTASHPASIFLAYFPFELFDALILVIHGKLHSADERMFRKIRKSGKQFHITRSFSDNSDTTQRIAISKDIATRLSLPTSHQILFFSNRTGEGIKSVFDAISTLR